MKRDVSESRWQVFRRKHRAGIFDKETESNKGVELQSVNYICQNAKSVSYPIFEPQQEKGVVFAGRVWPKTVARHIVQYYGLDEMQLKYASKFTILGDRQKTSILMTPTDIRVCNHKCVLHVKIRSSVVTQKGAEAEQAGMSKAVLFVEKGREKGGVVAEASLEDGSIVAKVSVPVKEQFAPGGAEVFDFAVSSRLTDRDVSVYFGMNAKDVRKP